VDLEGRGVCLDRNILLLISSTIIDEMR
jgi:hypothetical protein